MVTKSSGTLTPYYYHYDEKGSITKLTDKSGKTVQDYAYDAFGNLNTEDDALYNPIRYTGQYTDSETGLIYLRNRYYDPTIGRFTQEDPIKDGLNWYVYCANDPVNMMDRFGLKGRLIDESEENSFIEGMSWSQFITEAFMYARTDTDPVKVYETDDSVTIYAYFSFTGELADMSIPGGSGTTYRQAFLDGAKETWEGTYNGKNISAVLVDLSDGNPHFVKENQKSIQVEFHYEDGRPHENKIVLPESDGWTSKIDMYISMNNNFYYEDRFKRVAGHEFGHSLGIGDLYAEEGKRLDCGFYSVMSHQDEVDGAQPIDYALMFEASKLPYGNLIGMDDKEYWKIKQEVKDAGLLREK